MTALFIWTRGEIQREFTREEFLVLSEEKKDCNWGFVRFIKGRARLPKCQGSIPSQQGLTFDHVSIKEIREYYKAILHSQLQKAILLELSEKMAQERLLLYGQICGLYKDYEGQDSNIDGKQAAKKKLIQDSYMVNAGCQL